MSYRTLLFDLDATLYPADNGFWAEIGKRIEIYLQHRMGFSTEETITLKKTYYDKYGTTLRGLQFHHHVNPQDYLEFVHDIPTRDFLQPDLPLRKVLQTLPQPKWIFTNSDQAHASRVLAALNLADCFEGIISLESMDYECKPHPLAYQIALKITGETDPHQVVYLDDSLRNLAPAKAFGFFTVHVGNANSSDSLRADPKPDLSILRPHDLLKALPALL